MQRLNTTTRFTIGGILFGFLFPILATIGVAYEHSTGFIEAQAIGGWLLWIVDSAPIFLGFFARYIGLREHELETIAKLQQKKLTQDNDDGLNRYKTLRDKRQYGSLILTCSIVFAFLFTLSTVFFLNAEKSQKISLINNFRERSAAIADLFKHQFEERLYSLDRMALRFSDTTITSKLNWNTDAKSYYIHFPGFQALEWADTSTKVQWVYPINGNEKAIGLILAKEKNRKESLELTANSSTNLLTRQIQLKQSGNGFLSLHPTHKNALLTGYIVGVFRSHDLFKELLSQESHITVWHGSKLAYQQVADGGAEDTSRQYENTYKINIREQIFKLTIAPSQTSIYSFTNHYNFYFYIFLLFISVLTSLFFGYELNNHNHIKQLLKQLEVFRKSLDTVAVVAITDRNGKITEVNDYFCKLSGYERHFLIGKDHRLINSSHHSKRFRKELWAQISSGLTWHGEICNRAKDGSHYWMDTFIIPSFDEAGIITGFASIRTDITAKKKIELEKEAAKQLAEEALQVKSRFLANMSHEIRTPMNAVLSCTNLLLDSIKKPENVELLETIRFAGDSLLNVINDILDFSKIESGKIRIENVSFDLNNCTQRVVDLFRSRATEKQVQLSYSVEHKTPPFVKSDVNRITQILGNLISNAVKFTDTIVDVCVTSKHLGGEKYEIQFSIKDDGIGISEEVQANLFEIFSQADVSTTRKFGGSGLGLAICKGLTTAMGGKIWVESKVDSGSVFHFSVPVEKAIAADLTVLTDSLPAKKNQASYISEKNAIQSLFQQEHAQSLKILVAEDNAVNQLVARKILEKLGYQIDIVNNGAEAVVAVNNNHYDLVFMDLQMPEMDGVEATEKIRTTHKSMPKIYALTASVMQDDRDRCLKAGMNGFLMKPLDPKSILEILRDFEDQAA